MVSCAVAHAAAGRAVRAAVLAAGLDILVIQGTVVSAEHVSTRTEPLNLKEFIARFDLPVIVGGCASYSTALHLMRTGAVGVLVGVGPGQRLHDPRGAGRRRAAGDGDRGRRRGPARAPARDGPVLSRDRRRRHAHRRRHREGDRVRRGRRDDRLAAHARVRGAGPRLPLGDGHVPPDAAPWGAREDPAGRVDGGDPGRARRTRTTAPSTCSARWRRPWRRPGTPRSRSSRRPSWWSRPRSRPRGRPTRPQQRVGMGH